MHASHGEWLIRHAGKESGPFDVDRLRTLARRGALTRFHQLSQDGQEWVAATQLRAVFNEDGSIAAGAAGGFALDAVPATDLPPHPAADAQTLYVHAASAWASPGAVAIRNVQIAALVTVALALAAPSNRGTDGGLEWWFSGSAITVAVHALCGVVAVAWAVALFMPPTAAMGSALAAVSAVLAAAAVLPLYSWAGWAAPAGVVLPIAALLVACESRHAPQARLTGLVVAVLAGIGAAVAGVILYSQFSAWGAVSVALYVLAAAALVWAGVSAMHGRSVFVPTVLGCVGLVGALFAAAIGGLQSQAPIQGARGAVSAILALSLSVLTWSGAHQAFAGQSRRATSS